ncbi:MAG: (d)CMP kinase [Planctomycetota bacterium]
MSRAATSRQVPVIVEPHLTRPATPSAESPEMKRLIVTIDGPAGTGKSSVARDLAQRLGLEFLDTGAMYRAATALAIERHVSLRDEQAIVTLLREADLHFNWQTDPPTLMASGASIMDRLRDRDVSAGVSPVSQLAGVRRALVELQRRIGEAHPRLVSEGRDQGSVVFFDADIKFYLDAGQRVRALRRARQLEAMGRDADVDDIEREIADRDHRDASREVGPLIRPDDAITIDTSQLSQDQVVDSLERTVRERIPQDILANTTDGAPRQS